MNRGRNTMNLKTQEGVKNHMSAATSEVDWNNRCDQVKAANGGYPDFWYATVIMSGVAAETSAKWKKR